MQGVALRYYLRIITAARSTYTHGRRPLLGGGGGGYGQTKHSYCNAEQFLSHGVDPIPYFKYISFISRDCSPELSLAKYVPLDT
jgi:hypothetical protein